MTQLTNETLHTQIHVSVWYKSQMCSVLSENLLYLALRTIMISG